VKVDTDVVEGLDVERKRLYVALFNERFDLAMLHLEGIRHPDQLADDDRQLQLARTRALSEATDGEA